MLQCASQDSVNFKSVIKLLDSKEKVIVETSLKLAVSEASVQSDMIESPSKAPKIQLKSFG